MNKYSVFKRGAMRFEDYNYNMFNPYILIDSQKGAKLQQLGYANMSKLGSMESGLRLTEQQLSMSVVQQYQFDDISVGEHRQEQDEQVEQKAEEKVEGKAEEENVEETNDDEEGDDEDEDEYNLFFEQDEIESTKEQQQVDAFEDIRLVKAEMLMKGSLKVNNKIQIEEYMPKEHVKVNPTGKKRNTKSMKSSYTGDQMEERMQQQVDIDEALAMQMDKSHLIEEMASKEKESNQTESNMGDTLKEPLFGMVTSKKGSLKEVAKEGNTPKKGDKGTDKKEDKGKDEK